MKTRWFVCAIAIFAGFCFAQEAFMMEDLSVRAKVDYHASRSEPPVSIKKTGDFLVLRVNVENDSRDVSLRRQEIDETVGRMIEAAAKSDRIQLHSGEHPVTRESPKLKLSEGSDRADTSSAVLYIKVPLKADDDVPGLTEELRKFVFSTTVAGRTELLPGEVGLSLLEPEQYRHELVGAIAKDVVQVASLFGESASFTVTGLDQKMKIRRVGVTEIELYLDYGFVVSSK
ncbi:MAG: hypothetical protein PHW08_14290 [Kiritimatiellae bacterium]|nr:hypothetical protein [Kiritimatiellia bacterium]